MADYLTGLYCCFSDFKKKFIRGRFVGNVSSSGESLATLSGLNGADPGSRD